MTGDEKIPLHRLDENEATKAVTEEPPIYSKKSFLKKTIQNFMLCEELRRIRQYQGTGHDLSPDWENQHHRVPDLHIACFRGDKTSVRRCIEEGFDINRPTENPSLLKLSAPFRKETDQEYSGFFFGETPLMMAAQQGHVGVVKLLLANGAKVNQSDSLGLYPLAVAAAFNRLAVVKYLLKRRAFRNKREKSSGMTPLILACLNNHTDMVKLLMKRHVALKLRDIYGRQGIHYAAWNYNTKLVTFLSNYGVDINTQDSDGNTPLHLLVSDFDFQSEISDDSEAHTCMSKDTENWHTIINNISKEYGMSVNIRSRFHRAFEENDEEFMCLICLLKLGASPTKTNRKGQTPLHVLCARISPNLIRNGYVITETPRLNQTLLVMFRILVEWGCDVEAHDDTGMSGLDYCVERNNKVALDMIRRWKSGDMEISSRTRFEDGTSLKGVVATYGWNLMIEEKQFLKDIDYLVNSLLFVTRPTQNARFWTAMQEIFK